MSKNFKSSIKSNITTTDTTTNDNDGVLDNNNSNNDTKTFILKKKADDNKEGKKVFNVYREPDKLDELDAMCKKSRYSRNELVNMMIDYCIANWKIEQ